MAAKIKLYTWSACPFCIQAKSLLENKGMDFEEVVLDGKDQELQQLREQTGMRTVPQVFINEELIGGYSELKALEDQGQLDQKLNA